ncbi:metallophosphoesterase family protein [thermophilic bacterium 2918]|uniref:Metallophosphoesterase family protein n=2 Tax=Thermogemmata fonticola TaxID=2755323 RepID=A0A7V9ABP6_9BACT|nr:metallophosphoesterase family protein [Thermogemmata fonticola]
MTAMDRRTFLTTTLTGGIAASSPFLWSAFSAYADRIEDIAIAPPPRPAEKLPQLHSPRDTLFLTWQGDPTSTMTIQWLSRSETPTVIRYASLASAAQEQSLPHPPSRETGGETPRGIAWQKAVTRCHSFGRTDLKVHRCELTHLRPGTEYVFQIGEHLGLYRFRTMPAKANDLISFVSGGDCGIGPAAIASNLTAARQDPYFVLIAGDLGYDNGTSATTAISFIKNYSSQMVDSQGRLIPLITCIGNHEVRGGYKGQRSDATYYLPLFDGLYRETTYNVLDIGDYLSIVLLDSGHISPIPGEQTDWLASVLKERQDRPHLYVAYHVPAYPSVRSPQALIGLGTGELQRQHWCPLFERYRVDVALEHHDHVFKRTHPLTDGLRDRYGVPYLGDGSWGKLRTPASPEKRPYLARVSRNYHITLHRLEGEQRFHLALTENGKVADVYMTQGKRPAKRG